MIVRRRDGAIFRQLRTLYNIGAIGDMTDGQLLERFATDADEVAELAFSALVERHEAMVWRVCLAIVRDEHEAEDAFQATFLVLVRKRNRSGCGTRWGPGSIRSPAARPLACGPPSSAGASTNGDARSEMPPAASNPAHRATPTSRPWSRRK